MQWPIEKTRQIVWDALQGYGRIEWKRMLRDLEKTPNMAYHDILNKFDLTWGVKGLIMTQSNLVITWKDRTHMSIISWFPLGLHCSGRVSCILNSMCNWISNLCQTIKTNAPTNPIEHEKYTKTLHILLHHYIYNFVVFGCMCLFLWCEKPF